MAGLPVEPSKSVGPTTTLVFLGVELDSIQMSLSVPHDKLVSIKESVSRWRGLKACRKHDLLTLIGVLSHASKVVYASRIFLHRLIDLSTMAKKPDHFIRLNAEAWSDLQWWAQFMELWNGVAMLPSVIRQPPAHTLTSDASGSWGCGTFTGSAWFLLQWAGMLKDAHIVVKELVPIVIASALWAHQWRGKTIEVLSDNTAAVFVVNNNSSKDKEIAHLLRCLAIMQASFQFQLRARHLPGTNNTVADALFYNNLTLFHSLHPQADQAPTSIPLDLISLLVREKPDWMSHHWMTLWTSIFKGTRKLHPEGLQYRYKQVFTILRLHLSHSYTCVGTLIM